MSQFVDECRKEWNRLGVPEAAANEMAADLEADLAEAESDGASPEEVLGNGYFDAKSFAASWATARGVATSSQRVTGTIRVRSLMLAVSGSIALGIGGVGLLILAGHRVGSASMAVGPSASRVDRFPPRIFVGPHRFFFAGPGSPPDALGWVLLVAGLIGLGITIWLWRPWSTLGKGRGFDRNVGLPSYL